MHIKESPDLLVDHLRWALYHRAVIRWALYHRAVCAEQRALWVLWAPGVWEVVLGTWAGTWQALWSHYEL